VTRRCLLSPLVLATVIAAATPGAAVAANLYVAQGGSGAACSESAPCTLTQAVSNADTASDRDSILVLGALTFNGAVNLANSPIDLVGSGRGAGGTSLDSAAAPTLRVGNASSASSLRVTSTAAGPAVVTEIGGDLTSVSIADTAVGANGVSVDPLGGPGETVISDAAIAGAASGSAPGLAGNALAGSTVRLVDSTIAAAAGASWSGAGTLVVQRSSLLAGGTGLSATAGTVRASSSVLRGTTGVDVAGAAAELRQLTVVAASGSGPHGVRSGAGSSVSLVGSIVRDFASDLTSAGGGALSAGTSNFTTTTGPVDTSPGGNRDADPQFRDPLGLDFRLRRTSPMIDAAGTAALGPDESPLDRDSHARALDGDGEGTPQRDIGAYEYRRPNAVLSFVTPGATGVPVTFSATASAYPDGEIATHLWDLDGDGLFETNTGPVPQAQRTYTAPAGMEVRLRVVGHDGATDDAVRPLTVFDRTRPRLLSASVVPSVFAVDRRATPVTTSARRGTTFRWRLSERATVRISLEERAVGRRVGRRCLPATRARRRRPRCIRFIARGSLTRRNRSEGAGQTPFTGRVGRRPLPLGRYRATFTATDPSRNRSAPRRVYFRVVLR
jgi:PKD domain